MYSGPDYSINKVMRRSRSLRAAVHQIFDLAAAGLARDLNAATSVAEAEEAVQKWTGIENPEVEFVDLGEPDEWNTAPTYVKVIRMSGVGQVRAWYFWRNFALNIKVSPENIAFKFGEVIRSDRQVIHMAEVVAKEFGRQASCGYEVL